MFKIVCMTWLHFIHLWMDQISSKPVFDEVMASYEIYELAKV